MMPPKKNKPTAPERSLEGILAGDSRSPTVLLDGVEREISTLNRKELQRAQLEKAERLGNATARALAEGAMMSEARALQKGPHKSATERSNRAGTSDAREEFRRAAVEKWEEEGRNGEKRSTNEEMAKHLKKSNPGIGALDSTAASWLKGLQKRAYRKGLSLAKAAKNQDWKARQSR